MILAYVAGPYTAPDRAGVERNIRAAEDIGIALARAGIMPCIPHANTSRPEFEQVQGYEFWIEGTLELLKRCDILVALPNWRASKGATGEVEWQWAANKPVFLTVADAVSWARSTGRIAQ